MCGQKRRSTSARAESVTSNSPLPTIAAARCGIRRLASGAAPFRVWLRLSVCRRRERLGAIDSCLGEDERASRAQRRDVQSRVVEVVVGAAELVVELFDEVVRELEREVLPLGTGIQDDDDCFGPVAADECQDAGECEQKLEVASAQCCTLVPEGDELPRQVVDRLAPARGVPG